MADIEEDLAYDRGYDYAMKRLSPRLASAELACRTMQKYLMAHGSDRIVQARRIDEALKAWEKTLK